LRVEHRKQYEGRRVPRPRAAVDNYLVERNGPGDCLNQFPEAIGEPGAGVHAS